MYSALQRPLAVAVRFLSQKLPWPRQVTRKHMDDRMDRHQVKPRLFCCSTETWTNTVEIPQPWRTFKGDFQGLPALQGSTLLKIFAIPDSPPPNLTKTITVTDHAKYYKWNASFVRPWGKRQWCTQLVTWCFYVISVIFKLQMRGWLTTLNHPHSHAIILTRSVDSTKPFWYTHLLLRSCIWIPLVNTLL